MKGGGVSFDDPRNRIQLILFISKLIDDQTKNWFKRVGCARIGATYDEVAQVRGDEPRHADVAEEAWTRRPAHPANTEP